MKKCLTILPCIMAFFCSAGAQNSQTSFQFLEIPSSAHVSALGGTAVSLPESDPTLTVTNPASLSGTASRKFGVTGTDWLQGTVVAGGQFSTPFKERSSYQVSAHLANYGTMKSTTSDGTETGTFKAKDFNIGITYAYMLSDNWSGGVTGHLICSRYSYRQAVAVGADLGLRYSDPDDRFTAGLAATGLGGQVKAFEDTFEKMPFNLSAGITVKLEHAPLRFTFTADKLTHWRQDYFYSPDGSGLSTADIIRRHISFGTDFLISDNIWIAAGCNLMNRSELAGTGRKGMTGITTGAGIELGKVSLGVSYGKFQVATSSLICNIAYSL